MTNINDWLETWTGDHCDSEGGGGGEGDIKTLTMTVIGDTGSFWVYPMAQDEYYSCGILADDGWVSSGMADNGQEITYTVVYTGDSVKLSPQDTVKSITGDATYDEDTYTITATGDFTIAGFYSD